MTTSVSTKLCRGVLDLCQDAVIAVDGEKRVLLWNRQAERLLGYPADTVLGQPLPVLTPASEIELEASRLRKVEGNENKIRFRGFRVHRSGEAVWVRIDIHRLNENEHGVTGFCYVLASESGQSQLSHATETERLERAHRLANLGFWEFDGKTSEVFWSSELYKMFDLDPVKDRPLTLEEQARVFTPSSWKTIEQAIEKSLKTGEPYQHELEYKVSSDSSRWMLARGEAIKGQDNETRGLCGTAIDITELKQTELQLERSRERLSLATTAAKFGVWDIDLSTGILVWDEMMHTLYGTDPETFGGRFEDWRHTVHPEDLPEAEAAFQLSLIHI